MKTVLHLQPQHSLNMKQNITPNSVPIKKKPLLGWAEADAGVN